MHSKDVAHHLVLFNGKLPVQTFHVLRFLFSSSSVAVYYKGRRLGSGEGKRYMLLKLTVERVQRTFERQPFIRRIM